MKILIIIGLLVLDVSVSIGQITSSPAYDPNVYVPRIGIEIDTIYGSKANQQLGDNIWNTGIPVNGTHGKLVVGGLDNNPIFLSSIEGSSDFNLSSLEGSATKLNIKFPTNMYLRQLGHFRDSKQMDALVDTTSDERFCIFWTDANGNFDSTRVSLVGIPYKTGYAKGFFAYPPFIGKFTSDSVDDFIFGIAYYPLHPENGVDTANLFYFGLYKGGVELTTERDTLFPDTMCFVGFSSNNSPREFQRYFQSGDFNGDGLVDLVARGGHDLFIYKHKKPFSLTIFAESLFYDTLYARWQNSSAQSFGKYGNIVSPAITHNGNTKPAELLLTFNKNDGLSEMTVYAYSGGLEFGNKRLFADSEDYRINVPRYYDSRFADMDQSSAVIIGDITGTGHNTLYFGGDLNGYSHEFFYVLGKDQDDMADMVYIFEGLGGGTIDSLTADSDQLTDIIYGHSYYETSEDYQNGKKYVGTIHLIHGSSKIPVKLGIPDSRREATELEMSVYPNPCDQHTVLQFENRKSGVMWLEIVNSIGQRVRYEEIVEVDGLQQYAVDMSSLPVGVYHLRLSCPADGWSATANIIKQGVAQKLWSFDLKKMVGR